MLINIHSILSIGNYTKSPLEGTKLVTHAMGEIDGYTYTNSKEAFGYNYKENGSKVFEVDLQLTKDGVLVARHDWSIKNTIALNQMHETGNDEEPWTYDYYKKQKILNKYTPIGFKDIVNFAHKYPDVIFILDTKYSTEDLVIQQFKQIIEISKRDIELLKRIIPQIYNQEMLQVLNSIYKFENVIYTLYASSDSNETVLEFVRNNNIQIKAVTMHTTRVTKEFVDKLHKYGFLVFTHPISDFEEIKKMNDAGVDGYYSTSLTEMEILDYIKEVE